MKYTLLVALLTACTKSTGPVAPELPPPTPRTLNTPTPSAPLRVWIDADPSVGVLGRDVDDGLALLQALHSPELEIVGVSSVFGNATHEETREIAERFMAEWSPNTPVFPGADSPLAGPTAASEAIVQALRDGPVTIVALGPVTNVAQAYRQAPEAFVNAKEVLVVAGRYPGQRFSAGDKPGRPFRDLNFELDSEGMGVLLASDAPLTLAPFELSRQVTLTAEDVAQWKDARGPISSLAPASEAWLTMWQDRFGADGFFPFDTLAVGVLVRPDLITCRPMAATIEIAPDDRPTKDGSPAPDKPYLHVSRPENVADERLVKWCDQVQADSFHDDLQRRLTRP